MSQSIPDTLGNALRIGRTVALCLLAVALALPAPIALAQMGPPPMPGDAGQPDNGGDPPSRVGRLSYISGTVSFHTLDGDQWEAADVNYPVTEGLSFWTEPDSRATLQLGHGVVRLDGATEVDVQQFDDQVVQVNVPQGSVNFRLRRLDPGETYQVTTPSGTVALTAPGRYRIDASVNGGPGGITIFQGSAQPVGDNFGMMMSSGPQAQPQDIDNWSDQQEEQVAQTPSYLSPDIPGVDDLSGQGNWDRSPAYGNVWYPPVQAGWAPYRYGHWAFVPPWGWTWVDDAPWGFAPFHYGRWVMIGPRWAWVPGQVVQRPVYAPALVAFVGGGGLSVAIGLGSGSAVGWVPLGPREVYVPPYGGSIEYVRRVNSTNVTNVNNITINNITVNRNTTTFVNASAATVVRSDAMTRSTNISKAVVQVPPTALRAATVTTQAPVKPTLATVGAGPTVVKALGGNVTQDQKRDRSAGPKFVAKPLPATLVKPLVTSPGTAPGSSKGFTPAAGAGTGTNPSASTNKVTGPAGQNKTLMPAAGAGTGTNPNPTGNDNTNKNANTLGNQGAPGPKNRFAPTAGAGTGTNPNANVNTNTNTNTNTGPGNKGEPGFKPAAGAGTGTNPNAHMNTNTNTGNKGPAPGPNNRLAPGTNTNTNVNTNTNTGNKGPASGPNNRFAPGTNTNTNVNTNTNAGNKGPAPGPNNRFAPGSNANTSVNTNTNAGNKGQGGPGPNKGFTPETRTNTNASTNGPAKLPPPPQQGGRQNAGTNANANKNAKCDPKVQKCP